MRLFGLLLLVGGVGGLAAGVLDAMKIGPHCPLLDNPQHAYWFGAGSITSIVVGLKMLGCCKSGDSCCPSKDAGKHAA